jgi:TatA/E family protein of Tat protein translocase
MGSVLLFLNISGGEILVILIVVYLVFGPKKIPELARMVGKGINELRRATNEIKNEITKETSVIKKDLGVDIDLNDPLNLNKLPKPGNKPPTAKPKEKPDIKSKKKPDIAPDPLPSQKPDDKSIDR